MSEQDLRLDRFQIHSCQERDSTLIPTVIDIRLKFQQIHTIIFPPTHLQETVYWSGRDSWNSRENWISEDSSISADSSATLPYTPILLPVMRRYLEGIGIDTDNMATHPGMRMGHRKDPIIGEEVEEGRHPTDHLPDRLPTRRDCPRSPISSVALEDNLHLAVVVVVAGQGHNRDQKHLVLTVMTTLPDG